MTGTAQEVVLSTFLVFCRIGTCLMLMPAFSSPRIPVTSRLFFSLALSMALAPIVLDDLRAELLRRSEMERFVLVATETVVGAVLGSLARVFFAAVEAAGQAISSLAGLTGIFNQEITSDEQGSPLSSLLSLSATVLLLASDMHLLIFKGMLNSYWSLPPGMSLGEMIDLKKMVQTLSGSFYVVLQISGPFVFFALLFNLAIGLLNKLVPQIPVYFVSSPFVAAGGLVMLQFLVKPMLSLFVAAFAGWLAWR